jgi:hypothetical protein
MDVNSISDEPGKIYQGSLVTLASSKRQLLNICFKKIVNLHCCSSFCWLCKNSNAYCEKWASCNQKPGSNAQKRYTGTSATKGL